MQHILVVMMAIWNVLDLIFDEVFSLVSETLSFFTQRLHFLASGLNSLNWSWSCHDIFGPYFFPLISVSFLSFSILSALLWLSYVLYRMHFLIAIVAKYQTFVKNWKSDGKLMVRDRGVFTILSIILDDAFSG